MTKTEERLLDALAAEAAGVCPDSLRPLVARPGGRSGRRLLVRRWLVPLAAAVSAAVIATIMVDHAPQAPRTLLAAGPPGHYVWYSGSTAGQPRQLLIRAGATGAVVGQVPDPVGVAGYEWVGAQAGFRDYVAATFCSECGVSSLYRFRLTGAGRVTELTAIKGITVHSGAPQVETFSLAPDGSHLAYVATAAFHGQQTPAIALLNLHTGARTVWRGGMARKGLDLRLRSLSWTLDSRRLAFAAMWCRQSTATVPGPTCTPWTVRSLDPARAGGALNSGSMLLRQEPYPAAFDPVISPNGSAVMQMVYPALDKGAGGSFSPTGLLTSISLATGRQRVLHRWASGDIGNLYGTGGVVLVWRREHNSGSARAPGVVGWIGESGVFQPLPTS